MLASTKMLRGERLRERLRGGSIVRKPAIRSHNRGYLRILSKVLTMLPKMPTKVLTICPKALTKMLRGERLRGRQGFCGVRGGFVPKALTFPRMSGGERLRSEECEQIRLRGPDLFNHRFRHWPRSGPQKQAAAVTFETSPESTELLQNAGRRAHISASPPGGTSFGSRQDHPTEKPSFAAMMPSSSQARRNVAQL